MGSGTRFGARQQSEFIDGAPRRRLPRPDRLQPAEPTRAPHIDLRVIRTVDTELTPHLVDWGIFIDDLGRKNHALGTARALGSVAITYVSATRLNTMVREQYPRDFHHDKRKVKLFRKIASNLNAFIREASHEAFESRIEQIAAEHEERRAVAELEFEEVFAEDVCLSADEQLEITEHAYGPKTLNVNGMAPYGTKYGLDLSTNDVIHDERRGFLGHLKNEGFDISALSRNWDPKASLFQMHQHVGMRAIMYSNSVPGKLRFDAPRVEQLMTNTI